MVWETECTWETTLETGITFETRNLVAFLTVMGTLGSGACISFLGSYNKVPQIGGFKTVEMYSLKEALSKDLFLASLLASGSCWQSSMLLGLWQHNSNPCLYVHMASIPLCVSASKFHSSYKDTSHTEFRILPNPV